MALFNCWATICAPPINSNASTFQKINSAKRETISPASSPTTMIVQRSTFTLRNHRHRHWLSIRWLGEDRGASITISSIQIHCLATSRWATLNTNPLMGYSVWRWAKYRKMDLPICISIQSVRPVNSRYRHLCCTTKHSPPRMASTRNSRCWVHAKPMANRVPHSTIRRVASSSTHCRIWMKSDAGRQPIHTPLPMSTPIPSKSPIQAMCASLTKVKFGFWPTICHASSTIDWMRPSSISAFFVDRSRSSSTIRHARRRS